VELEGQLELEELDGLLSGQTHRDVSLLLRREKKDRGAPRRKETIGELVVLHSAHD
jgi:hypothetical protein